MVQLVSAGKGLVVRLVSAEKGLASWLVSAERGFVSCLVSAEKGLVSGAGWLLQAVSQSSACTQSCHPSLEFQSLR